MADPLPDDLVSFLTAELLEKIKVFRILELKNILGKFNVDTKGTRNQLLNRVKQLISTPTQEIIDFIEQQYKLFVGRKFTSCSQNIQTKKTRKCGTVLTDVVSDINQTTQTDSVTCDKSSAKKVCKAKSLTCDKSSAKKVCKAKSLEKVHQPKNNKENRMSHPMSNVYYSRLTPQQQLQQKQQQMAQQAAAFPMTAMAAQNHTNMYANPNMSHFYNMRQPAPPPPPHRNFPEENPMVKFKVLPFFDKVHELIRPTTLLPSNGSSRNQENSLSFKLTNDQAAELGEFREIVSSNVKSEYNLQVQLRIVALNNDGSEQDDHYPPNLSIKVNQRPVQLPNPIPSRVQNKEPVRPSRPLNITVLCKICPWIMNCITVNWTREFNSNEYFVISVNIVKKLYSDDLLSRLKTRGIKPVEYTTNIIREKLSETDMEIANDTLQVNLACPLSRTRMTIPCRASSCTHLQCFDALTYLQMNEKKQTWVCPVCNQSCPYGKLFIDGYFMQVLESYKDGSEIILHKNGSWTPYVAPKEAPVSIKAADIGDLSIVCLDDDAPLSTVIKATADTIPALPIEPVLPPLPPPSDPEIVTLD